MKRTIILVALLLLAGAVANAQVCTIVSVGGADIDIGGGGPPNNDANLSIIAIERCDGTVRGHIQDTFAGGISVHAEVTCLYVDGDDAWISGFITKVTPTAFNDDFSGVPISIRVRNNGKFKNDPPDQASFNFFFEDAIDCLDEPDYELFDLVNGQVQIMER
jgi:hypothetical protein